MTEETVRSSADDPHEAGLRLAVQMHAASRLYRAVVHDLKSPLNALVVNLELLRASLDPADPKADKQERYLRVLQEELLRLNRSIEHLLPATEPPTSEPGRFDLGELVDEVLAFVAPQARQQRVRVLLPATAADADRTAGGRSERELLPVRGYRDRFKQALVAVAVNALEAMPDGGELEVTATREDGRVRVRVRDTGPGFPDESRERQGELYFSTKEGHLGLGLYVAHQVIKSAAGSIEINSSAGGGVRVDLLIPIC